MYLPTFWKLTTEATLYRFRHVAGYVAPVGFLGKSINQPTYYHILSTFINLY
jgi:hypothetical protein